MHFVSDAVKSPHEMQNKMTGVSFEEKEKKRLENKRQAGAVFV